MQSFDYSVTASGLKRIWCHQNVHVRRCRLNFQDMAIGVQRPACRLLCYLVLQVLSLTNACSIHIYIYAYMIYIYIYIHIHIYIYIYIHMYRGIINTCIFVVSIAPSLSPSHATLFFVLKA